jgi:hypothetical protein
VKKLTIKLFGRLKQEVPVEGGVRIEDRQALVAQFLQNYIASWNHLGADYRLLDVDDELSDKPWEDYASRLNRFRRDEFPDADEQPIYLFIIGGNDVIPMPRVHNPFFPSDKVAQECESIFERDLEADMLYAYKDDLVALADWEGNVWREQLTGTPRYLIGRLPLEEGAADFMDGNHPFDAFVNYFNRALAQMVRQEVLDDGRPAEFHVVGLEVQNHLPTTCETNIEAMRRMLAGIQLNPRTGDEQLIQHNFVVSPALNLDLTEVQDAQKIAQYNRDYEAEVRKTDMLTFILHGGHLPSDGDYNGQFKADGHQVKAFTPEMMRNTPAKVVSGICCWGAKYIGFSREHSMLLSALYSHALLFMGSCRTARGLFDDALEKGAKLGLAQRLMHLYLSNLVAGDPAGLALAKGKDAYLKNPGDDRPDDALATVLEFNLYGDPALFVSYQVEGPAPAPQEAYSYAWSAPSAAVLQHSAPTRTFESRVLYSKNQSLTERVRNLVDSNLRHIKERITQQLYAEYGLSPDELTAIHTMQAASGAAALRFTYSRPSNYGMPMQTYVDTDNDGRVQGISHNI